MGDLATWQAYIEGLGGVFSTTDIESQEFHLIQEGKISYGYNTHLAGGNRISTITNTAPDGSTTRFEYQRPANYGTKVWKIVEYGNADTLGQTVTFTYNTGYTVVRNSGTDDRHGNYDDINTYFVFDQYGRVINTYTTDNDDTSGESVNADYIYGAVYGQYETQENAHNSLKIEGTTGGVVTNYLLPDAEDWILSGSCSGNGTTFHFTPAIGEGAGATQYRFLPAGNYTLSFTAIAGGAGMWTYVNITSSAREEDVVDWHFSPHDGEDDALMKRFSISFDIIDYEDGGERVAIAFSTYAESGSQGSTLSVSDIQLEKGIGASEFSLVRMGDFESFTVDSEFSVTRTPSEFWTSSTGTLTLDAYASPFSVCAEVEGIIDGVGYVKQRIFEAPADELNSYDTDSAYAGNNNGLRYIVSGFGLASFAIPSGIFRLRADVIYYQGAGNEPVTISHNFDFLSRCRQWQYVCGSFSTAYSDDAENDYSCIMAIDIYCEYSYQIEAFSALFNKIAVVVDDGSSTVQNEYDADGRLIKKESRFYSEYYEYDANGDLTRIANNRGELTEHTYATEEWNKHRLLHTVTYDFVCADGSTDYPYKEENIDSLITKTPKTKTEYIFNTYGQLNRTTAYPAVYSGTDVVQAPGTDCTIVQNYYVGTLYSRIFGALKSSLDMMTGIYTYYFYDEGRGLLLATVSNDGKSGECYTYDELGNLTSVRPATYVSATEYSALTNAEEVSYTYNDRGLLTKIETQTTAYTFSYDPFGKASSIGMENSTIVSYTYHNYNGKLASITYANGFTEEYTYDALDNLSEIWYTTEDESYLVYQYQYTADGQLYSVFNYQEYKIRYYEYDMSGRLTAVLDDNNGYSYYTYTYDDNSNVATKNHYIDATQTANVSYSYTYDTDNTITGVSIIGIGSISYTYDDFNRLSGRVVKNTDESFKNTVSYIYRRASGQTGMQISAFSSTVGASTSTYSYGYDNARNITKITDGEGREVRYYYDDLSQLVREDNTYLNATYVYTYDNAGNLLSKVTYALTAEGVTPTSPTSTVTYGYSAATGDRLTSYNGAAITYDAIGNPLSYNNGTAYTFTWQGRFMQTATVGGQTYTFTYNEDGLRLDKTSNSNGWYLYYYEGDMLIGECFANHYVLMYVFDADGSPIGHILYPTSSHAPYVYGRFWYEKNLQGDIIAVYDDTGTKLISYTYDAWGNFTTTYHNGASATHGSAQGNLRYRGYYYDKDLGMYWLTTRYYDAKVGRFISPDNLGYLGANGDLNSYNLYAYCSNNPVMYEDPTGNFAISIGTMLLIGTALGILFGAGVDVATQLYENRTSNNDIDLGSVLNSSLVGGALGFSSAAGVVFLGPIIAGASAASASSTLITFGASVGVSALAGAGGYMLQETINGRAAEVKVENVLGHASIVAIEGACNFGVGGMIGSIGNVGQKGKIFTKEWIGKFIFGQEFSFPIKHLLNRLRKGLWE